MYANSMYFPSITLGVIDVALTSEPIPGIAEKDAQDV